MDGWYGTPKAERVCAGCGEKLTLAHSMPLWWEDYPKYLWWHHGCKLASIRSTLSTGSSTG